MKIELGESGNHFELHLQGGWVSREIAEIIERVISCNIWNFHVMGGRQSSLGDLGNEFRYIFNVGAYKSACDEFVDYLNTVCRYRIPTAFTAISVNPYKLKDYDNTGGLTLMLEIAKESGCPFDAGSWNTACKFLPESTTQYNKVIELLRLFKMEFNNWDYVNGVRPWIEEPL